MKNNKSYMLQHRNGFGGSTLSFIPTKYNSIVRPVAVVIETPLMNPPCSFIAAET